MGWEIWDGIHDDAEQAKRSSRAYLAENTPVRISTEDCTGSFAGSHGHYETSLERCTCVDFSKRKKPCKHMYRLAIELGLFGSAEGAESDKTAIKLTKTEKIVLLRDTVAILENFADEEQRELKEILLETIYRGQECVMYEDSVIVKSLIENGFLESSPCYGYYIGKMGKGDMLSAIKTQGDDLPKECKLKKDIAAWMVERKEKYGAILFPRCAAVRLAKKIVPIQNKLYTYLIRKFDTETYYDLDTDAFMDIPKGAHCDVGIGPGGVSSVLKLEFPNDEVTDLLDLYGVNRCRGWSARHQG